MPCQPGVGLHFHHITPTTLASHRALQPKGAEKLGNKRQGADATPKLMAHQHQHQHPKRHHNAPEHLVALMVMAIAQTRAVIQIKRPRIPARHEHREDQASPASEKNPAEQMSFSLRQDVHELHL